MRVSTEPERRLLAHLGDPQRGLRVVHVTGSKGKGTTSAMIAAGLARAGLRVGRYGSPHVVRIHERVVIDGVEVGDLLLAEGLERAFQAREALVAADREFEPTWFDVMTAAALWIFREAGVAWVVAEVGLGGRLDSTNVLDGEVCVITNVELEHTAVLGATRAAIAAEKAGILKPGCSLVTGLGVGDEGGEVVARRAAELGVRVRRPTWAELEASTGLLEANRSLAALALDELGVRGVGDASGRPLGAHLLDARALAAARLPGRLQRFVVRGVPVLVDGAHTPVSVRSVLAELRGDPTLTGRPVVVLGLACDKDLDGILKALLPAAERLVCTSVGSELHRTPEEISGAATALGATASAVATPRRALDSALEVACGRWVLVVGSLYLAGAVLPHLAHPHLDASDT